MANYSISEIIRENRKRKGLTQAELCGDSCSVTTLSRIENGVQMPELWLFIELCEKLGISVTNYPIYVSNEDMILYNYRIQIDRAIAMDQYDKIEEYYEKMKEIVPSERNYDRQFFCFVENLLEYRKGTRSPEEMEKRLVDALKISLPEFNIEKLYDNKIHTLVEIELMNQLALVYRRMGKNASELKLLFHMDQYFRERDMDIEIKMKWHPVILFNLSSTLGKMKSYEESLRYCEEGLECCIEYDNLRLFAFFTYNKACNLAELHLEEEAKEAFKISYVITKALKLTKKNNFVWETAVNEYHFDSRIFE